MHVVFSTVKAREKFSQTPLQEVKKNFCHAFARFKLGISRSRYPALNRLAIESLQELRTNFTHLMFVLKSMWLIAIWDPNFIHGLPTHPTYNDGGSERLNRFWSSVSAQMNVCWLGNELFLTEKIYAMVSFKEARCFFIYSNSKITLLLPVMFAGTQCSFLSENYALQTASLFKLA
mgnify:CR=1 FL=1